MARRQMLGAALLAALAGAAGGGFPAAAPAQELAVPRSPVLTLDQDRLFAQSAFGQRAVRGLEDASAALAAENREIEARLTAEERDLTDRRASLPADQFRALADIFDAKVVATRQSQDQKARELNTRAEAERARFYELAFPVLLRIVQESGAAVLLNDRAIILSADAIDITDLAIARVDAEIGDGAAPEPPAPVPPAPEPAPEQPAPESPAPAPQPR
jgi:Skp family chaperone for outer membrane proteins